MLPFLLSLCAAGGEYFKIASIDSATGRGVPLVELTTTNGISVYTDRHGIVAWNEPGLMDRDVYFSVRSHGYIFPSRGRKLRTMRGESVVLNIERVNIAERLYRITGQGIYRDSILTGTPVLPDVIPLYRQRRGDGSAVYSTESGLKSAEPVGRVWRNPMEVLILDPAAAVR